jgi:hypothetical protein
MWWLAGVALLVIVLVVLEWRSWKKPVPRALQDHWGVNGGRGSGRAVLADTLSTPPMTDLVGRESA